jgi:hypothetical protein
MKFPLFSSHFLGVHLGEKITFPGRLARSANRKRRQQGAVGTTSSATGVKIAEKDPRSAESREPPLDVLRVAGGLIRPQERATLRTNGYSLYSSGADVFR